MGDRELICEELVEGVSDYLDGLVSLNELPRWDRHLAGCSSCRTHLSQMRLVIRALRALRHDPVPHESTEQLRELFRSRGSKDVAKATIRIRLGLGLEDDYCFPGAHIAYFFESAAEFAAGVSFLETGLRERDACVVFGHDDANEKILRHLAARGFDVERLVEGCRLSVLGGGRTGEAMLAEIASAFQSGLDTGAPVLRLLGNIGWGRSGWPSDDATLGFEARVTEAARQFPCVVVCMYDVRALAGRLVLKGGFETHPLIVRGRSLHQNPHYVPSQRFLAALREESGLMH